MIRHSTRPATPGDRSFLWQLHVATMRDAVEATWGWDDDVQRRMFDERFDPASSAIILLDGVTAGMLSVAEEPDQIWLASIQIAPEFQSRGLGTAIIQGLAARAAVSGKPLVLQMLRTNEGARRLYERLGFSEVEVTPTHLVLALRPGRQPRG